MKTLSPVIQKKIAMFQTLQDNIQLTLLESSQPLSVLEIQTLIQKLTGRAVDNVSVRNALQRLQDAGLVSKRTETVEERLIRSAGKAPKGYQASLYWAKGKTVPARTVTEAVPGMTLKISKRRPASGKKVKTAAKSQTADLQIERLIEIIVQERTSKLQARVAELEDRLAKIKRLI
jgi:hypothetical protein